MPTLDKHGIMGSASSTYSGQKGVLGKMAQGMIQSLTHYLSRSVAMPTWPSLTVREAAQKTGYNEEYLRRLIRAGKIEAMKFGSVYLIKAESLEAYLKAIQWAEDRRGGPRRK